MFIDSFPRNFLISLTSGLIGKASLHTVPTYSVKHATPSKHAGMCTLTMELNNVFVHRNSYARGVFTSSRRKDCSKECFFWLVQSSF